MAEVQTDNDYVDAKVKTGSTRPENPEVDDNAVEESEITNDDVVDILMDDDDEDFYDEGSFLGTIYEQVSIMEVTEKITVDDYKSKDKWEKKFKDAFKEVQDSGKEKKISKFLSAHYYGILGNTFNTKDGSYVSLLPVLVPYIKKYCDDKTKNRIRKDIESTIKELENIPSKGNQLTPKQKGWLKDIKVANI